MFRSLRRRFLKALFPVAPRGTRPPRSRPRVENLETRCLLAGNVTITSFTVPQAVEGMLNNPSVSAAFTDTAGLMANQLTATVNYGDGTAVSTATITKTGATTYTVTDQHTFPEESGSTVPPFAFTATLTVFENATPTVNVDTQTAQAQVLDAPLFPGNPVTPGMPVIIRGGGTADPVNAATALANYKTTIGGADNGGNPPTTPLTTGFRTINWDGVRLDGTDFGGGANTVVIDQGKTVGIPLNRFQERGVFFGAVYAVSTDEQMGNGAFVDVNPAVSGLFPSFSPHNTFAMFNDNGIDFKFVLPSAHTGAVVSAASRGFGAIFENVRTANTTSIEYFHGGQSLGKFFVNPGNQGQPEFLGVLFNNPIVTNVLLTLGTDVIFRFNGTAFTPGGVADNPGTGHNLVVTDDFVYPEPQPVANGFPILSGAGGTVNANVQVNAFQGIAFNGVAATFSDANPNATARDFTATINWGDGHTSNGVITANASGGFNVSGTNTYARAGSFPISVDVMDFGGGPGAGGSQPVLSVTNTAKVTPKFFAVGGAPGLVELLRQDNTAIAQFHPFGSAYTGGVSVAIGDVNGDGIPDLVVGATTGNPNVKVYNGAAFVNGTFDFNNPDASAIANFFPYALQFNVGANVAVGDVNNDGFADIVTGATRGNPDVRVFNGKDIATGMFNPSGSSQLLQFFPYGLQFNVGANVAVGDINKDGFADIVTGATVGNPDVRVYNGKDVATGTFNATGSSLLAQFFPFALQFNVGAFVAVGDANGDTFPDVIVGSSSGNPNVKVYSGQAIANKTFVNANPDASLLNQFFAFAQGSNIGVTVGAADFTNAGMAEIITGATNTARYRVVAGNATGMNPPAFNNIDVTPPNFDPTQGVFVGAA